MDYQLYGTAACHLCEQAERDLQSLGLRYTFHDIVDDPSTLARYQARIPVVVDAQGRSLDAPFSLLDLLNWIAASHPSRDGAAS